MWVWDWYLGLSNDVKSFVVPIVAAVVGALTKWLFDRKLIRVLKEDGAAARKALQSANRVRDKAQKDSLKAIQEHSDQEAQLRIKTGELERSKREVEAKVAKIEGLLEKLRSNDAGLWNAFPKQLPFADFDSRVGRRKPIVLTVANNKGGVGKTTVVGNLLAYFDKKGKSVLAIDMDYQGSLSTLLQGQQDAVQTGTSNVNALLERGANVSSLITAARGLGKNLTRSSFVSAFYDLALFEDRMMVEWLLQENDGEDVRYRLANVLLQPQVQHRYDVVLIDVPPRLSAGTINALCSSTHVLIPTIFNPIAAEPVANFLDATTRLLHGLNPTANFVGVVETMALPDNIGRQTTARGRGAIEAALGRHPGIPILQHSVPRGVAFAAGDIAYLANSSAKAIFDELGDEISQRIGL
jgi:chromosome partitioning protein